MLNEVSGRKDMPYLLNLIVGWTVRGYQSQVKWAGRVPCWHAVAYAWPRALHSRFACAQALRAGELSRGVGLRGFESHSPHHTPHTQLHERRRFNLRCPHRGIRRRTTPFAYHSLQLLANPFMASSCAKTNSTERGGNIVWLKCIV